METPAILYALLGLSILSLLLTAILLLRGARQSAALSRPLQDEQILTPDQHCANYRPRRGGRRGVR